MQKDVVTVGLDLAKNVFQVQAIGSDGKALVRRQYRRAECRSSSRRCRHASSAWRRELIALG